MSNYKEKKFMNILVTGASGFIGSEFLLKSNKILNRKFKIYAIVRSNKYNKIYKNFKNINFIRRDLKKDLSVLKTIKFKMVFHFAAQAHHDLPKKYNKLTKMDNTFATRNLIKFVNKDTLFIFTSTDKVYDPNSNCNENSKLKPQTYLASQKMMCERIIKKNFKKYFIFRLPIVHSDGIKSSNTIIDQFLINLIKNREIKIFSNVKRSFIKTNEFNKVLLSLSDNFNYGTYNIGTPLKSYYDRVHELSKKTNKKKLMKKCIGKIDPKVQKFNILKYKKAFRIRLT